MLKRGFLLIALAACAHGLKGTIDMELPVKDYAIFSEFGFEVRDCVLAPCSHPCPRACQRNSLHSTVAALQRNGTMDLQFEVEDVQDISGPIFLYGLYYGQWELVSPATAPVFCTFRCYSLTPRRRQIVQRQYAVTSHC